MTSDPTRSKLHIAAVEQSAAEVRALIASGELVNALDETGATPLFLAASNDNLSTAKALIDLGADLEITNSFGNTPLWASMFRSRDGAMIRLLLDSGANPDHQNNAGKTPRDLAERVANIDLKQYFK